jgi:hypothetical protein
MTLDQWLDLARQDLRRRQLDEVVPVLEGIGRAIAVLRAADWNDMLDAPRGAGAPPDAASPMTRRG